MHDRPVRCGADPRSAPESRSGFSHVVNALIIALAVLALRLPFLNQAIQGDDFYYLKGAEHALIDPLHPSHARYVFEGVVVDMRGHPHPPLNSWILAALLALFKSEREIPLHAVYIVFSLLAALSAYAIAHRFSNRPVAATLLFIVTPAFVINGTSLEADLPFVAFFLAAIAAFVYERYTLAALAGAVSGLIAYQSVVLTPILLLYNRRRVPAWTAALAAPVAIGVYQLFERISGGALPATVLAGYMPALQTPALKLRNAGALTAHTAWLVFPLLAIASFIRNYTLPLLAAPIAIAAALADPNPLFWLSVWIGASIILHCVLNHTDFLARWVLVFFATALILFFAGSARYLLPIALPLAILVSQRVNVRWLYAGASASALFSSLLASVNYQHWDQVRSVPQPPGRVFVNGEWGMRHYLEASGALPLERDTSFRAGDSIVSSAYANPVANGFLSPVATYQITSAIPLRLVGLGSKSGYSSVAYGLRPFDISRAPMDRITVQSFVQRAPTLSRLTIGTPQAATQILSGVYNNDRWTTAHPTVLLKGARGRLEAEFFIPPQSPARTIQLLADGRVLATQTYPGPGKYTIATQASLGPTVAVSLQVDRTFTAPPDQRQLGVLLIAIGFE